MLLAAINRLPVQRRGECPPQDNHIWRRGRGSCSPGKAGTKAQDLLLAQFLGCNHPTPPPHERSIRDCQECSKGPIKLALGAHKEEACACRESLNCAHCGSRSHSAKRKQAERRKTMHRAVRNTRQVPCYHKFMELGAF